MKNHQLFIYFICLVSAMGGLLFGYDWVVIGGAKPFYEEYFHIAGDEGMQALAMSIALLGCLLGATMAGFLADRYGRKKLLVLSAFIFFASSWATGAATTIPTFIIARLVGANYMAFAISAGAIIRTVTTTIEEGFSLPKVEKFEELINERTKGILICNPNNPTGYLYTRREMNQIRDLVKKYDLFLFSDEVYREFIYTGSPYISACHLEGIEQNVVLIDSVSKRYSECGIRIGALITKNPKVRKAVMKFCQARLSPPLIGQIAAEASLDEPEEYTREMYDEYVERRKCLIDGLNRIPGVYSPIPMGAFYTVAKLPVDDSEKFCAWCLEEFDYEGETVMMAPASGFYTTPGKGKNEVRVAYVLKKEDLVRALYVLRKALDAYPGRVDD